MAQRIDHEREGRRRLPAARVEEVVTRIGRTPVGEHAPQTALRHMCFHQPFGHVGEAATGERGIQQLCGAVEGQLPLHADPELAAALLEFPGVQAAMGRQAQIDAVTSTGWRRSATTNTANEFQNASNCSVRPHDVLTPVGRTT